MKTTAIAVAALLASAAMAQPHHGRHGHQKKDLHKRKYETTWVTSTMYATLIIDEHGTSLQEPSPAQFYPSTTSEETTTSTKSTSTSSTSTSTSTSESTSESSTSTTPEHTSVQPEPTTSSTTEAAATKNEPTTTSQAPVYTPTTAETAQPTSASGSGSSGSGTSYSGQLTFYDVTGTGACGNVLTGMTPSGASASEPAVVAVAVERFTNKANANYDPICGKIVKFTYGGKTGYGRVMDMCQGCAYNDLDVNPEAFANVESTTKGRISIEWDFE